MIHANDDGPNLGTYTLATHGLTHQLTALFHEPDGVGKVLDRISVEITKEVLLERIREWEV